MLAYDDNAPRHPLGPRQRQAVVAPKPVVGSTLADSLGMKGDAKAHGHLGGLLSGKLGVNRYEAGYAPDSRSKCYDARCKDTIVAGSLRMGKRPPAVNGHSVRVHWYHPHCIFASFSRVCHATKKITKPSDVEKLMSVDESDRAEIESLINEYRRTHESDANSDDDQPAPAAKRRPIASCSSERPSKRQRQPSHDGILSGPCAMMLKERSNNFHEAEAVATNEKALATIVCKPQPIEYESDENSLQFFEDTDSKSLDIEGVTNWWCSASWLRATNQPNDDSRRRDDHSLLLPPLDMRFV